jgi:hypothetical protein
MIAKVERMSDSPEQRPDLRISDSDRDRAAVMSGIEVKRAPARQSPKGNCHRPADCPCRAGE